MSNEADTSVEASVRESLCADCKMDRGCACANNHDECEAFREAVKAERADVGSQPEQKPISPGPWRAVGDPSSRWNIWTQTDQPRPVASGGPYQGAISKEADAHLIAAAPDMLAELKRLEKCYRTPGSIIDTGHISSLIAKAEGRE